MWKTILLLALLPLVAACQSAGATSAPDPLPTTISTVVTAQATSITVQSGAAQNNTGQNYTVQSHEVLPAEAAGMPIRLMAPTLNLAMPIETMRWQVMEVEGKRQAVWEVPATSAGWHINSARPGTAGNLVLSGHHLIGAAVFAPLTRGELTVGAQLVVTDDQGRSFLYQVSEVSQPIPVEGSATEEEQAVAYIAPTTQPLLTMVTGWPDFSDTHYLFVRAEFVGTIQ